MSGVEAAGLVIGLISGTIAIVDATKKIYDAAKDQQGLPAAFREVAQRLPLVQNILNNAKARADDGQVDDEASRGATSILEACKGRAQKLEEIFRKVVPQEGGSRLDRYYRAARTLGKDSKVEMLMKGILDDLNLLSVQFGMETEVHIQKLEEAIKTVSALEPSVPDHVFDQSSYINNNLGAGTQNNFNASGGENYNNLGPGNQFMGAIGTLNLGKQ
jgi:hypothetical protein